MFTIYHNNRCSKSRQTLSLLEQHAITPTIIDYLNTPPSAETIQSLLLKLGLGVRDIMRNGEAAYKTLGLADNTLSDQALIDAIVTHPKLLQRPIVVKGDKAIIGRPPENVLELI